ncbi:MAG: 16S rRNA (cytidine(1402)-2'-O)-methyltransferase, partial [Oscillospiraceae bacterium]|nr:16S rRNA (cytidine(1402)-2'-O)-methyltransferase [Oscillospiraceae bacterium]
CRELTKLHEEVLRFDLASALAYFQGNAPRGEFVLVVGGAPETLQNAPDLATGVTLVRQLMASGLSRKEAARQAAAQTGLAKNQLYAASMEAAD